VKDILAYLRLLVNPADSLAARRIINVPPRGIGAVTVRRLAELETQAGGLLPACALALERGHLRSGARERVAAFVEFMNGLAQAAADTPFPTLANEIIERSGYAAGLRDNPDPQAVERLQNLQQLLAGMEEQAAAGRSLEDYLEVVALATDLDAYDDTADRVTLMTLHAAKGLEFPVVFMTGMEEGLFPHARAGEEDIEEERRLCYVGMTRAMRRLCLTHAWRRRVFGDFRDARPSRFLREIPPRLLRVVGDANRGERRPGLSRGVWEAACKATEADLSDVVYDTEEGLSPGVRVRHPHFGVGIIRRLEGSGDGRKVTVAFRRVGMKKLMLKFAGLLPV